MKILILILTLLALQGCLATEAGEPERKMTGLNDGRNYQCRAIQRGMYNESCIDLVDCYVDGVYAVRIACATNVIVRQGF